jgi:hypothetical protein
VTWSWRSRTSADRPARSTTRRSGIIYSDRDFNDAIFQIHYGPAIVGQTVFYGESFGSLLADVTDDDSTALQSAAVAITAGAQSGDKLELATLSDSDGDGFIDGTSIAVTAVSDIELVLEGDDTLANYERVINDIRFTVRLGRPHARRARDQRRRHRRGGERQRRRLDHRRRRRGPDRADRR